MGKEYLIAKQRNFPFIDYSNLTTTFSQRRLKSGQKTSKPK